MKRKLILHPFLFASYAVLALLANNIMDIQLAGLRALLFSIVGAVLIVVVLKLILKDSLKAGLISSAAILLIYAYGHIKNITQMWKLGDFVIGQAAVLLPLWLLLFGLWVYWVMEKSGILGQVSDYFNWVSLILNIFPIYAIGMYTTQSSAVTPWMQGYISQVWNQYGVANLESTLKPPAQEHLPDIYYIILDAYTRSDVLDELYGYDNSPFINFLKARGFYVADASTTNYTDTELSISSSLNMVHIDTMPEYFRQNAKADGRWIEQNEASKLIKENRVSHSLKDLGYTIVAFDSGYDRTRLTDADRFESVPQIEEASRGQIIFELMLLDSSIGQLYTRLKGQGHSPLQTVFDAHRERVLFTLKNLSKYAGKDGNYFVYAHIVSPHTPYVFGPNGEPVESDDPYTLMDAHPGQKVNIKLYRDQVNYINTLVMDAIDQILSKSDTPPIIIIQGDHSSKVYSQLNPPDQTELKLLLPILNAYYLPGNGQGRLYPTITPVNSFRLVFDEYFGAKLNLLEDKSYVLKPVNAREAFVDACQFYQGCPP